MFDDFGSHFAIDFRRERKARKEISNFQVFQHEVGCYFSSNSKRGQKGNKGKKRKESQKGKKGKKRK